MSGCSEIFVKVRPFGEHELPARSASPSRNGKRKDDPHQYRHLVVDEGARKISLVNPNNGFVHYGPGTFDEIVDDSDPFAIAFPNAGGANRIARRVVDRISARSSSGSTSTSPTQNIIVAYGQTGSGKTHTIFGAEFLSQSISAQQNRYTMV